MIQNALKVGLIVAVLGFVIQDANAFGHCGRWGCGGCGYGGYGGWGYGSYGYGGWGYGGYGYGGYLASSSGAYSSSAAPSTSRLLANNSQPDSNSIVFTVNVPADAKVFVNDRPTTSTGVRRQYKSTGLEPSGVYVFQVRVEFIRDGKPVSEEKVVQLTAGQAGSLAFEASSNSAHVADVAASAQR